jgi:hypothetical protein
MRRCSLPPSCSWSRRPRCVRRCSPDLQTTCLSCCSSATAAWGRGAQRKCTNCPPVVHASLTPRQLPAACCCALRYVTCAEWTCAAAKRPAAAARRAPCGERRAQRSLLCPPPPLARQRSATSPFGSSRVARAQSRVRSVGRGTGMVLAGESGSLSRPDHRFWPSLTRLLRTTHTRRATSPPSAWTSCVPALRASFSRNLGNGPPGSTVPRSPARLALLRVRRGGRGDRAAQPACGVSQPLDRERGRVPGRLRVRSLSAASHLHLLRVLTRAALSSPSRKSGRWSWRGRPSSCRLCAPALARPRAASPELRRSPLSCRTVGHGGAGALPDHHKLLLPRRARHHRGVRRDGPGVIQQREAVAERD